MKRFVLLSLLFVIAPMAGCSTWSKDWSKHLPWSSEARLKKSKFETPARMIAIWTPDVLSQTGKPPTRGFGGRLYFYNDLSQAIPVEGQLMVYAFDDAEDIHTRGEPDRKYAFTPEQFTAHYSKSDLGASYSVWIPWDTVGGEPKNISLVPIFTSSNGQIVTGQQAKAILPGRKQEEAESLDPPAVSRIPPVSSVQSVAHYEPSVHDPNRVAESALNASSRAASQQMRTSSIPISPNLQRQLSKSPTIPLPATKAATPERMNGQIDGRTSMLDPSAANGAATIENPSTSAKVPALSPGQQLSTRFERMRSQARAAQAARASLAGSQMSQFHAALPSLPTPPSTATSPIPNQAIAAPGPGSSW